MPKLGMENLQDNVVELLNKTEDLSGLETNDKSSLVAAINEVLLLLGSGNNDDEENRVLLANTIGSPLVPTDTIPQMCTKLNTMLEKFKTNLELNGVDPSVDDKFNACIDKINNLQTFKIVSGDSTLVYNMDTPLEFKQTQSINTVVKSFTNEKYSGVLKNSFKVSYYYPVKVKVKVTRGSEIVSENEILFDGYGGDKKVEIKYIDLSVKKGDVIDFSMANASSNGFSTGQTLDYIKLTCDIIF